MCYLYSVSTGICGKKKLSFFIILFVYSKEIINIFPYKIMFLHKIIYLKKREKRFGQYGNTSSHTICLAEWVLIKHIVPVRTTVNKKQMGDLESY